MGITRIDHRIVAKDLFVFSENFFHDKGMDVLEISWLGNGVVVAAVRKGAPYFAIGFADRKKLRHIGRTVLVSFIVVRNLRKYLRDKLVLQPTQEKNRYIGDLWQRLLADPVLMAEACQVARRGKDPKRISHAHIACKRIRHTTVSAS